MFDPSCLFQMLNWCKEGHLLFDVEVKFDDFGFSIKFLNVVNNNEFITINHVSVQSSEEMINSLSKMQMAIGGLYTDFECKKALIFNDASEKDENAITINTWKCSNELRVVKISDLPSKLFPKGKTFIKQNPT